ncbi:MAG TPA: DNA polymerase/3'-5' exonuclease PolX [Elusimicrobiota bacterium]|nr:DNA polymerase/3'-5' exonuclease PolX [Elusimicrobiota bacterium]
MNRQFAGLLYEMANLLELDDDNPFRIRAYKKAAMAFEGLTKDISTMTLEELMRIPGVGRGLAEKADEFSRTGRVKEHQDLRRRIPQGLLSMLNVSGLGAKRVRFLYETLKIDSLGKLKAAAEGGKLRSLPGFAEKMETNILKGLEVAVQGVERMTLGEARLRMAEVLGFLKGTDGIIRLEPAGSLRRGKETVGDLDILCSSRNPDKVITRFIHAPFSKRTLAAGETKASVELMNGIQCDLRVVEDDSFGAALQYFTGSKEHNVALRERALKLGYTVNEYGLYRTSDDKKKKPLAGKTEEEIYKKLGLQWIPPELREQRGEIEAAEKGKLPKLIEEADIRGCFHSHTSESDGRNTLEEMAAAARKKGWEWLGSADHSQALKMTNGLSPDRMREKIGKIKALNKKSKSFQVLCSSEVDILADGSMDYDDDLMKELDFVIASVHSSFKQPEEKMTERIIRAMDNPHVDCIGHLSGRLLGQREAYAIDYEKIFEASRRTGTALEINGQPDRQDLYDVHATTAKGMGIRIATNTDAHSIDQLDHMSLAVTVARRAWLEKKDVLNTMSAREVREWCDGE